MCVPALYVSFGILDPLLLFDFRDQESSNLDTRAKQLYCHECSQVAGAAVDRIPLLCVLPHPSAPDGGHNANCHHSNGEQAFVCRVCAVVYILC